VIAAANASYAAERMRRYVRNLRWAALFLIGSPAKLALS